MGTIPKIVIRLVYRLIYRLQQFWHGWRATLQPEELAAALCYLPLAAQERFRYLPSDAQRHSLNVFQTLQRQGEVTADLAAAALLHDVGKSAADEAGIRITLWVRGPLVLLEQFAPWLLTHWTSPDTHQGWRYLLYVHQMHPMIGAQWAKEWGCSPLTCWLIEHHQDDMMGEPIHETEQLLALLQRADSLN